jgi:hypothetical protein
MSEKIEMLYDVELRRPACVLLQAVGVGPGGRELLMDPTIPWGDWIVSPTPGLRRVTGTREEWVAEAESAARVA